MTPDDIKRLATDASALHGIRIDPDDPLMAVVTFNRLVFEHVIAEAIGRLEAATRNFEIAAERVQVRAGALLARELRECSAAVRKDVEAAETAWAWQAAQIRPATVSSRLTYLEWLSIGLIAAIVLVALGFWYGSH